MIFGRNRDLGDRILELAISGPISVKAMHERLSTLDSPISLRAVYKAVNGLTESGVLLKVGKLVRVDQEWVRKLRNELTPPLPVLTAGERLTYTFVSLEHLDTFWKTIVLQLEEYESDGQVFFYNPHNFWAYMPERTESERVYYQHFSDEKLHAFFVVGGSTQADREFKRAYQNEYLQIDSRNIPGLNRTNHITILKDFIITVHISKKLALQIDNIYESQDSISGLLPKLKETCRKGTTVRFVLEHNPLKARKLKKLLSTNFYFKTLEPSQ
jgi:hypothetical protein